MNTILEFSLKHDGACLFVVLLLEQTGLPIPAAPCLLAAGAFCAAGQLNFGMVLALTVVACLLPDLAWFTLGRHSGKSILRFLCRFVFRGERSLEQIERDFSRRSERVLVLAKFIPGLSVLAPPLAGAVGMGAREFLLFDTLGSVLYTGLYLLLGFIFSDQLQAALNLMEHFGLWSAILFGAVIAGWLIYLHYPRRSTPYRGAGERLESIA